MLPPLMVAHTGDYTPHQAIFEDVLDQGAAML
jgi:hypothetical protein